MELEKAPNLEKFQVVMTTEHGKIENLPALPTGKEHPEPRLMVGSDQ